ncbi:MAG: hypothetical protein WA144_01125 [Candidatus Methanoperedens sp.]
MEHAGIAALNSLSRIQKMLAARLSMSIGLQATLVKEKYPANLRKWCEGL